MGCTGTHEPGSPIMRGPGAPWAVMAARSGWRRISAAPPSTVIPAAWHRAAFDGDTGSLAPRRSEGRDDRDAALGIVVAIRVDGRGGAVPGDGCPGAFVMHGGFARAVFAPGQQKQGRGAGCAEAEDGLLLFEGAAVGLGEFVLFAVGMPVVRPASDDGLGGRGSEGVEVPVDEPLARKRELSGRGGEGAIRVRAGCPRGSASGFWGWRSPGRRSCRGWR